MKYVDEFRDRKLISRLAQDIRRAAEPQCAYNIMEVCGTHTVSIARFALRDILPGSIKLISGPGCPVCVTPNEYIDKAIAIAGMKDVIITTFGDMVRVPGSYSSLEKEKANGRDIRMVYSSLDALEIAEKYPGKEVVFLGIGFETTAPTVAQSLIIARKGGIKNYSVLCGHKTMPEALKMLVMDSSIKVDAFLLPGHVSAIIGLEPYRFLISGYKKGCVISGFEPVDILQSILMVIRQKKPALQVQYNRVISRNGNPLARKSIYDVFEKTASAWRGIGNVKGSGLKIRNDYKEFDAEFKFRPHVKTAKNNAKCLCGHVLKGLKTPLDCRLFAKKCTPASPVGACMVSSEGTCAAYYKYGVKS